VSKAIPSALFAAFITVDAASLQAYSFQHVGNSPAVGNAFLDARREQLQRAACSEPEEVIGASQVDRSAPQSECTSAQTLAL
jgi:hypothetical protein